jgi:hypothetical protein
MLDTVKLCLNDWEIKAGANLLIQPSPLNYGTGELTSYFPLWRNENGEMEMGSKAYLNGKNLNVDIKPYPQGGVQCFVHFSIPKIHNGENYYSVGKEGTQAVLKQVEGELKEAGIKTNIEEASLSRIDTFQNVVTEEPFFSYSPLFSLLQASRKVRRDYGSTFLWSNTQQELCVYDKLAEMTNRKLETSSYPAQTMRFEYRLLNKKKIEKAMGFSKVKELPSHWGDFKETFKKAWEKDIFKMEVGKVEILASKQVRLLLEHFRNENERTYIGDLFDFYGAYTLARDYGIAPLKIAIRELEREKGSEKHAVIMKVQRAGKKLEEAQKKMELLKGESEGKTLASLYRELQGKVCLN